MSTMRLPRCGWGVVWASLSIAVAGCDDPAPIVLGQRSVPTSDAGRESLPDAHTDTAHGPDDDIATPDDEGLREGEEDD